MSGTGIHLTMCNVNKCQQHNGVVSNGLKAQVLCGRWEVCGYDYQALQKKNAPMSCNIVTLDSECPCARNGLRVDSTGYQTSIISVTRLERKFCPNAEIPEDY